MLKLQFLESHSDRKTFLLLLGWAALVLMLMSPDSPLHGPWGRCDSAIFFMSGKALMNGMRPYVDFADSKGPLLWLIYGVGYLLSPRSYTGVYVVSCLWYAAIFFFNYKTARIFLNDGSRSLAVTLLMSFAYFLPWFHFEVRAEDFATLPVAVSMYYLFRLTYGSDKLPAQPSGKGGKRQATGKGGKRQATGKGGTAAQPSVEPCGLPTVKLCGLALGGSFMALLLIKYTIAAMQGSMILVALWHYAKERKQLVRAVAWMAIGAVAVALPFLAYLWMRGALAAFLREYFFVTFTLVGTNYNGYEEGAGHYWSHFLANINNVYFLIILIVGGLLFSRRLNRYRYMPLAVALFFFLIASIRDMGYYFSICHVFVIYLFTWLLGFSRKTLHHAYLVGIAMLVVGWGVVMNLHSDTRLHLVNRFVDSDIRSSYYQISATMDGSRKPKMLCLFCQDYGYGLWSEALPVGKYWVFQYGASSKMIREHGQLFDDGNADYVIVNDEVKAMSEGYVPGRILGNGYNRCLRVSGLNIDGYNISTAVYKKNDQLEDSGRTQ